MKLKIYKTVVRPAVLYKADTWTTTKTRSKDRDECDGDVEMDAWSNRER